MSIVPTVPLAASIPVPILAAAGAQSPGQAAVIATWVVFGIWLAASAAAAVYVGVLRPRSVDGPLRIPWGRPAWPLLLVWLAGVAAWFGGSVVFAIVKQVVVMQAGGPEAKVDPGQFTPLDWSILATAPPAVAFLCLLVGDYVYHRAAISWLGFGGWGLGRGIRLGLLGAFIAIPWTYLVSMGVELLYKTAGYQHPGEHALLREMKTSHDTPIKWTLVAAAVVIAPFFEELLFRAHLQTLIRRALVWMSRPSTLFSPPGFQPVMPPVALSTPLPAEAQGIDPIDPHGYPTPAGFGPSAHEGWPAAVPSSAARATAGPSSMAPAFAAPAAPDGPVPGVPQPPPLPSISPVMPMAVLPYSGPPVLEGQGPTGPRRPLVWQTWAAIAITSLMFAGVHEAWSAPIIFFLSVCLGYAYERTGSLWTTITIHAAFNAFSTFFYLAQ